jgi:preprotein translocase subunit SecA
MRLFGSEKLMGVFRSLGVAEGEQIEHKMLSSSIEKAQQKIESNNYGIRKNLLDYDSVNNEQREIIYRERRRVLDGENMRESILKMIYDTVDNTVDTCIGESTDAEEWDLNELNQMIGPVIPIKPITREDVRSENKEELKQKLKEEAVRLYEEKEAEFPEEQMREIERVILLRVIDEKWMNHIDDMEQLRQGIGLQAYGQRDPKVEYKMTAYDMFNEMTAMIQQDTIRLLYHIRVEQKVEREEVAEISGTNKDDAGVSKTQKRKEKKIYPNDPCPCGSGLKYKQCHGKKK